LQPQVEQEDLAAWLDDVDHDKEQGQGRIGAMALPSGRVYSTMENGAVGRCQGMVSMLNSSSAGLKQLKRSATIKRSETKYNEATRLLFGFAEAEIRATPLEIVAFILDAADSRVEQTKTAANPNFVRLECVEHVNPHHTIVFTRVKAQGVRDRTFLNSVVAKQVAEDPPTFVVAVVSIPSHEKISQKDEAGAVRGENCRSFRLTEAAPGVTKLEYGCSLDLKGRIPQIVTNTIAIPSQMNRASSLHSVTWILERHACEV
jgi:hypothetical protein